MASTIHLYTSTPPLTCDGRRESQHVDTKEGNSNFTINCENQDSNLRPWALIPCQASCTSQRNQKSKLMEKASTIHLYTSTVCTSFFFFPTFVHHSIGRCMFGAFLHAGAKCCQSIGGYLLGMCPSCLRGCGDGCQAGGVAATFFTQRLSAGYNGRDHVSSTLTRRLCYEGACGWSWYS
jgi:hypothetical protein